MTKDIPLILVCNDDGVFAPGISALIEVVKKYGKVIVVAPDKPQSGKGMAITIDDTLRIKKISENDRVSIYSTSGTPVDCVKLAVNEILHRKPDIIVSGINHGSNASINVIYSGTMSAAMEGCLENVPSIGFSLLDHDINADFEGAKYYADIIFNKVLKEGLPKGVCLNVNFPKLDKDEIMGIKICRQANGNWEEEFDKRKDPSGREYYWMTGTFKNFENNSDTDLWALENNFVSVVPTKYDLTAYTSISTISNWELE